jgi:hypothetical protein
MDQWSVSIEVFIVAGFFAAVVGFAAGWRR